MLFGNECQKDPFVFFFLSRSLFLLLTEKGMRKYITKNYLFKVDIIFSEIFLAPYNLRGNYFDLEHSIEHISDTIKKRVINILTGPSAKTSQ